jgi:hypothetical protein
VRVVHSDQDTQQRRHPGQGQRDHSQSRPHQGQADSRPGGQGGVIARERPVAGLRAFGQHVGRRAECTARPFLVDHQLHPFADGVGHQGADSGQHGSGSSAGVVAADPGPPLPPQQHPENDQSALTGDLKGRSQPRRCVRHHSGQGLVRRRRGSVRHRDRSGLTQPARGKPGDHNRCHTEDSRCGRQPTGRHGLSPFLFHGLTVGRRKAGNPRRTTTSGPDDGQG